VRNHDEVAVDALGELDLVSADRLGEAVQDVWAPGSIPIVLDLSQVDFIDSTALRMLLSLRNDAKRNQHVLTLLPPGTTLATHLPTHGNTRIFRLANRPLPALDELVHGR
jgi:anti-anti-sigma factor